MTRDRLVSFLVSPCLTVGLPVVIIVSLVVAAIVASGQTRPMRGPTYRMYEFSTITYDGHQWVEFGGNFAHHPDCPCEEKP